MRRILVVDDDALIGQAIHVGLKQHDGFAPIRVFHERAPRRPLIAMSGGAFGDPQTTNPDFLRMAARLGATRCLCKPFKPSALLGVIDDCLSQAEPHRRCVPALGAIAAAANREAATAL
jgi:DNA-binding response OmpR family regulator